MRFEGVGIGNRQGLASNMYISKKYGVVMDFCRVRLEPRMALVCLGGGFSCSKGMASDGQWMRWKRDGRDEKRPATL